jgi:hypothetical protein
MMSDNNVMNNLMSSDTDIMINTYISEVNNDKILLLTLTTCLAFYSGVFADITANYIGDVMLNPFFQVALFVIIIHIFPFSPALGISLTIAILVTLQISRDNKVNDSMNNFTPMNNSNINNFNPINNSNINNQHDVYLTNPLSKASPNIPIIDLKLTSLTTKYDNMIKQGKNLLEDSQSMQNDLKKRPDIREDRIAKITENKGKRMINSGINLLESPDDGMISKQNFKSKFIKYDKSLAINNHEILSKYDELQKNFNELPLIKNNLEFDQQLSKTHTNELELLELIYKNKKDSFSKKKQDQFNASLDNIKLLCSKKKPWNTELNKLQELLS